MVYGILYIVYAYIAPTTMHTTLKIYIFQLVKKCRAYLFNLNNNTPLIKKNHATCNSGNRGTRGGLVDERRK